MNPPLRLLAAFQQAYGKGADWIIPVAGREMWVAANTVDGHRYTVVTPDLDGRVVFDRQSAKQKRNIRNRPLPKWARYATGALLMLDDMEIANPPISAIILGDEPPGPRYEHAIGMAFIAIFYAIEEKEYDAQTLLSIMERVQKEYF